MKYLHFICAGLLILGLADLPVGYYTILRIIVTVGAGLIIFSEFEKGLNFWIIAFGLIVVIFNPLIPVYLNDKNAWMPIDILAAILFIIKSFFNSPSKRI